MMTEIFDSFCNQCLRKTKHEILYSFDRSEGDSDFHRCHNYQVIRCRGCENVSYRTVYTDSDMCDPEDGQWSTCTNYPPFVSRKKPEWLNELPWKLRQVMDEVYIAIHADCNYLATVGARTAVDLLILEKVDDVGSFDQKVQRLLGDSHITTSEAVLLKTIIEAGNASAHRGFRTTSKQLRSVMDILEMLLEKFYASAKRKKKLAEQADDLKRHIPPRRPRMDEPSRVSDSTEQPSVADESDK